MPRVPPKPADRFVDADHVRAKTVVTSINRIAGHTPAKEACLVVIYGPDLGRKYNLEASAMTLGRSNKCDIQIDQESVSRAHSKIINAGRLVRIRDLGSTNGTYVNDELIDERTLADGDFIKIGRTIFKFLSGGNIERAYHEEIYRLTTVDGLTQIFNKRYFPRQLEREIARALRYRREVSLVMFDIDHFKQVNDTHGHLAGDAVLKTLAMTIKTGSGGRSVRALRRRGIRHRAARDRWSQRPSVRREDQAHRRDHGFPLRGRQDGRHHLAGGRGAGPGKPPPRPG